MLLPPKPGLCPECAYDHTPELPHNQQSMFYHIAFYQAHKRYPTWDDAMAHCSAQIQGAWKVAIVVHQSASSAKGTI
jgi:hypothetical protein